MAMLRQTQLSLVPGLALSQPLRSDQCSENRWTQGKVLLLLVMLTKSQLLRVKMSLLGSVIGFVLLISFLISSGILTVVAGGAVAYAAMQNKNT